MDAVSDNFDVFLDGFWGTIVLTFWSALGAMVFGTVLAAMRVSPSIALRGAATGYVNLVRNTPLTLVMFFTAFGLPILQIKFDASSNTQFRIYAIMALVAYTSCFVCEVIRSGIQTIPIGQAEAARSIGLTFSSSLRYVILPQALRSVIPPLGSVLIALTKNTSIASAFNNRELISAMRQTIENRGDAVLWILIATALAYMVITLPMGYLVGVLERKVAIVR
ncbi:amino acid ABC transporter permease [Antrihabitans sp. YC2-6]|uniref:amino acid ABC transporter permease n=1 Tax=Antrihabitans sp. YC2-6 TaxID=2799498 RepID=UPI0018F550D5|nr:amino acid ABC transporter permease [Antrihabitans sp. YC2-6]MBJ8345014.1 amino acid ABC transporter permease [Antrihabitans sp. YC2-6]